MNIQGGNRMKKLISMCLSFLCMLSVAMPCQASYKAANDEETNWANVNGAWYVVDENDNKMTGWYRDKHLCWYFLDYSTGAMKTGWTADGNDWYYLNPANGIMQTGWQEIDGQKYYMETSGVKAGAMVTGDYQIGNKVYTFDENGVYEGERTLTETELKLMEYQGKAAEILVNTKAVAIASDIAMYIYAGSETFDMSIDMDVVMNVKRDPKMSMEMAMYSMGESYSIGYYLKDGKFYYTDGEEKLYIELTEEEAKEEMETVEAEPISLPQYTNLEMIEEKGKVVFTFDSSDLDFYEILASMDLEDAAGMYEAFDFTLEVCQGRITYEEDGTPVNVEYYMLGECIIDGIPLLMEIGVNQSYDDFDTARVKYPSFSGYVNVTDQQE